MRTPVELIWQLVGDVYSDHFQGDRRRKIDALWQSMKDMAADGLDYVDHLKRLKNIFEADPYAPWGRIPVDLSLSEAPGNVRAVLQAGLDGGPSWEWWAWVEGQGVPSPGHLSFENARLKYNTSNVHALQSGGSAVQMPGFSKAAGDDISDRWDLYYTPGYIFGPEVDFFANPGDQLRWDNQGTAPLKSERGGLLFDVQGLDWGILHDRLHFNGASDWKQVWKMRIEKWPNNDQFQGISLSSFGDVGEDYHIRLSDDQRSVRVDMGRRQKGSSNRLSIPSEGDTSEWHKTLKGATPQSPVDLEFVVKFDAAGSSLYGEVWLDGEVVRQKKPYHVKPGRRSHTLDIFSELGEVNTVLDGLICPYGEVWESMPDVSLEGEISSSFGYAYSADDPIVASSSIRTEPWRLSPEGTVTSVSGVKVTVRIDEGWNEYAPDHARIDGDVSALLEKTHQSGRVVTYDAEFLDGMLSDGDRILLHPWFLKDEEYSWYEPGELTCDRKLPSMSMWSIGTKAAEVDLYKRWGELLGADDREDSPEYLSVLRGMQYGRLTLNSPYHARRACELVLDLPYARSGGVVRYQRREFDDQGYAKYDVVDVGDSTYQIDPYWKNAGLLKSTEVERLDALVSGVSVSDWYEDIELAKLVLDDWETWGTYIVSVDEKVGLSLRSAGDLQKMLNDSGDRKHPYVVDQTSKRDVLVDPDEDLGSDQSTYSIEDMIFDDAGTVVNNDSNPEAQSDSPAQLSARDFVETTLDGDILSRPTPKVDEVNQLGTKSLSIDLREPAIDIGRSLEPTESTANFGRRTLRMARQDVRDSQLNRVCPAYPRPYSLLWMRRDNDDLVQFEGPGIDKFEDVGSQTNTDAEMDGAPHRLTVVGYNTFDIYYSNDYGNTTKSYSLGSDGDAICINNNWVGTTEGEVFRPDGDRQWVEAVQPTTDPIHAIAFPESGRGYAVANGSNDVFLHTTTDTGSSWSSNTLLTGVARDASSPSFGDLWVATDSGLIHWNGTSTTTYHGGVSLRGVHSLGQIVWVCGDSGQVYKTDDGGGSWIQVSLSTSDRLNDIHFHDKDRGMVVSEGGGVFLTTDGGESWSTHTHNAYAFKTCFQGPKWFRLMAGESGGMFRWR